METRANHVIIGTFTLIVAAASLLFGLWAARWAGADAWNDYEVLFTEAVTGLNEGGSVRYNGIPVGSVQDLSLNPDDPRQVIARIRVESDVPVSADTEARLALTGLTGVAFIQLSGGTPDSPPLKPEAGRDVPRIQADDSALQKLMSSTEDIAAQAGEALNRLTGILSEENAENLNQTLANINDFTSAVLSEHPQMVETIADAREATARLAGVLDSADDTVEAIGQAVRRVDRDLLDALPELREELLATVTNLNELTRRANVILGEAGPGLAGAAGGLDQIGPALLELRLALREVTRLTARIEQDPRRFLLGQPPLEEYQPR